jgi:hypothetical protein
VGSVERGSVTWIEDFSRRAAETWDREIDMLFIDGDHELPGVRDDWEAWTPWVREGGIVALHDSNPAAPWIGANYGPVQVVREALRRPEWHLIDEADSMTVLRRGAG